MIKVSSKERIYWINFVKFINIAFIVLGHAITCPSYIRIFLYSFHVTSFITLSGYTSSNINMSFFQYLLKLLKRLLIPYFLWGLFSILVYWLMYDKVEPSGSFSLLNCLYGLVWGNGENGLMRWNLPMWYLPMFFIIQLLSYFFRNICNKRTTNLVILFTSVLIASIIYYSGIVSNLPFGIETSIYLLPFYIFGVLLKNNWADIVSFFAKWKSRILLICLLIVSIILCFEQGNIDYVSDQYRVYPLFVFVASMIDFFIIYSCSFIRKKNRIIDILGSSTLFILVFHKFPLIFFEKICPVLKDLYDQNIVLVSFFDTILVLVICYLFMELYTLIKNNYKLKG